MNKLSLFLSYIIPEKLETKQGNDGVQLNVYLDKGKVKVYTENTNYSGGKLKKVFKKSIQNFQFSESDKVLILGFGLGSIWEILRENHESLCPIHGVDYDSAILSILKSYKPKIVIDTNTKLYNTDCLDFIKDCKIQYNYVFIDLFIDNQVAPVLRTSEFWKGISGLVNNNSILVLNTMGVSKIDLLICMDGFEIYDELKIFKANRVFFIKAKKIE